MLRRAPFRPSIPQCAALATLLEVTASKPGNVHRGADFEDMTYLDFALSSLVAASAYSAEKKVGAMVLDNVRATRECVGRNTNLGTILLLAPLVAAPVDVPISQGVRDVLAKLDSEDARLVYEAIRLANPGGLGNVDECDVSKPPPGDLVAAMRLAADRDMVARQCANGFAEVLGAITPWLAEGIALGWPLSATIVRTHLRTMAQWHDSLIARKCGMGVAQLSAKMAGEVLSAGSPGEEDYERALGDLDFWLRADGHRRNPGTTADLIAAGLFVALREGIIEFPLHFYSA